MKKTVLFLMALIMSFGAFAQIDFENATLGEVFPTLGWGGQVATIVADPAGINGQSLQLSSTNYNTAIRLNEVTFYGGYTLADVAKMQASINRISGDVNWKNIQFWFGAVGAAFSNGTAMGATTSSPIKGEPLGTWMTLTFTPAEMGLSGALLALSTFDMAIGMNANTNVIIWDNIIFFDAANNVIPTVEPVVPPAKIIDFELKALGTKFPTISQANPAPNAVVELDPLGVNGQSLHLVATSWDTYVKVPTATLAEGKSLADVAKITFNIQFMSGDGSQNNYKSVLVFLGAEGFVFDPVPASTGYTPPAVSANNLIGAAASNPLNTWLSKEISFASLTNVDLLALNTFEMAIGFNHNNLDYFLDNISFFDADGNGISVEIADIVVPPVNLVFDFDAELVGTTYPTIHGWGWPEAKTTATVAANPLGDGNSLLITPANYDGVAIFNVTLDAGFTVADITGIEFDSYFVDGAERNGTVEMFIAPTDAKVGGGTNFNTYPVWLKTSDKDGSTIQVSAAEEWFTVSITRDQIEDETFNIARRATGDKGLAVDFAAIDDTNEFLFGIGISIAANNDYFLDNITINGVNGSKDGGTPPLAIATVKPLAPIFAVAGGIQVNVEGASIFDFSGRLVTKAVVGKNAVPAGLYIVKAGAQAVKVVVK